MMPSVKADDITRFARRDWNAVAELKASYWADPAGPTPSERLRIAEALRRQVLFHHPNWPSEEDREQDLETHARVSAALRRAGVLAAR
jgi:hypothetical protein